MGNKDPEVHLQGVSSTKSVRFHHRLNESDSSFRSHSLEPCYPNSSIGAGICGSCLSWTITAVEAADDSAPAFLRLHASSRPRGYRNGLFLDHIHQNIILDQLLRIAYKFRDYLEPAILATFFVEPIARLFSPVHEKFPVVRGKVILAMSVTPQIVI